MNILRDVGKELLAMFLADARLTISILILVAIGAISVSWLQLNPLVGGALLVVGALLILLDAVARQAKRSNSPSQTTKRFRSIRRSSSRVTLASIPSMGRETVFQYQHHRCALEAAT